MKTLKLLTLVMILFIPSILVSQTPFTVGEIETIPGQKKSGYIIVPAGKDCGEVKIPVTVINGSKTGPVLALVAGVHGYEYPPVLAMTRMASHSWNFEDLKIVLVIAESVDLIIFAASVFIFPTPCP